MSKSVKIPKYQNTIYSLAHTINTDLLKAFFMLYFFYNTLFCLQIPRYFSSWYFWYFGIFGKMKKKVPMIHYFANTCKIPCKMVFYPPIPKSGIFFLARCSSPLVLPKMVFCRRWYFAPCDRRGHRSAGASRAKALPWYQAQKNPLMVGVLAGKSGLASFFNHFFTPKRGGLRQLPRPRVRLEVPLRKGTP